jgi:hypothetical protein
VRPTVSPILSATGFTPWIPLDYEQTPPAVGLAILMTSSASITATAQYTLDDIASQSTQNTVRANATGPRQVLVNQTTTTVTVTDANDTDHGLIAGDSVVLIGIPSLNPATGGYGANITYVDATHYSFTSSVSQTLTNVSAQALPIRANPVSSLSAVTARTAAGLFIPATAVRLSATIVSGSCWLQILQGMSK